MQHANTHRRDRKPKRRQAGFTVLEMLIGGSVLAVALLGHTASIFSEHRLSEGERARSTAILAAEQFMETMRSDDDYAGLFNRLNNLQELSRRSSQAAYGWFSELITGYGETDDVYNDEGGVNEDTHDDLYAIWTYTRNTLLVEDFESTSTDFVSLRDGRRAFAPKTYYDEFVTPRALRSFHVAVEVPAAPLTDTPYDGAVLREDIPLQRFGLPADLNGDGYIDDASHVDDHRALPVIVTFRWTTAAGATEEMRLSTWLWGTR